MESRIPHFSEMHPAVVSLLRLVTGSDPDQYICLFLLRVTSSHITKKANIFVWICLIKSIKPKATTLKFKTTTTL